jgi:hypothetical protein
MPGGAGARAAAQIAKEASIGVAGVSRSDFDRSGGPGTHVDLNREFFLLSNCVYARPRHACVFLKSSTDSN